jgi:hypothetical protein
MGNLLTNDDLGEPAGEISLIVWGAGTATPGTPVVQPIGTLTVQADGSFVFANTGVPEGSRMFFNYRLTNSVGTSTGILDFAGAPAG